MAVLDRLDPRRKGRVRSDEVHEHLALRVRAYFGPLNSCYVLLEMEDGLELLKKLREQVLPESPDWYSARALTQRVETEFLKCSAGPAAAARPYARSLLRTLEALDAIRREDRSAALAPLKEAIEGYESGRGPIEYFPTER